MITGVRRMHSGAAAPPSVATSCMTPLGLLPEEGLANLSALGALVERWEYSYIDVGGLIILPPAPRRLQPPVDGVALAPNSGTSIWGTDRDMGARARVPPARGRRPPVGETAGAALLQRAAHNSALQTLAAPLLWLRRALRTRLAEAPVQVRCKVP